MKAVKASLGSALDRPASGIRFYLFYGPDESGSRALTMRLLKGLGNAEKFIVIGAAVKNDPASLADEAGAMALFGGARALWIEPAGEEIVEGVSALLDAAASESAVVALAGALRKTSGLLKLAEAHPAALAHCSYVPEGRDMERVIGELALEVDLDDDISGFGIRGDRSVTRERRTLRARYRLVQASSGLVLLDATAGSDAGIDVVSSPYATVAAEQTALERLSKVVADQIVARLALYASSRPIGQ